MPRTHELSPHPDIEATHANALEFLKDNPAGCQRIIDGAITELRQHTVETAKATKVQAGRLYRNRANAGVRVACQEASADDMGNCLSTLDEAAHDLRVSQRKLEDVTGVHNIHAERYLRDEQGASFSWVSRLAITRWALASGYNQEPLEENVARIAFERAHYRHRHGKNRYYRASNAMHAARLEKLAGNKTAMCRWLGRGALSVIQAPVKDPRNSLPAARTFVRLGRDLARSREALRQTIAAGGV